jgi:putative membrane protein
MLVSFVVAFVFLFSAEKYFAQNLPLNMGTWCMAGALIALGVLVPGRSPSNFLVYLGMYRPMVEGFKRLDPAVLLPIALGGAACLLLLSKAVDLLFAKTYTALFHVILGVVLASTVMIVPGTPWSEAAFGYTLVPTLVCVAALIAGCALGFWMSALEDKYK